MTFPEWESSRRLGSPINLYYFRYGSDPSAYYAHTDADDPVLAPGSSEPEVEYAPVPIDRGAITASGTLDKATLEIRMPQTLPLADLFRLYPPSQIVTLIIRQGHLGDPDGQYPVVWSGRLVSMKLEGVLAVFSAEPASTALRRTGLRRHYQIGCPHALYQGDCRADKTAATTFGVLVSGVNGNLLELPADWFGAIPVEKYIGGLVEWTTPENGAEVRTILRVLNGKDLLLTGLVRGLSAGGAVNIVLGCNHKQDDCLNLHKETGVGGPNIFNYGGQDWIPGQNPFGAVNRFY